MVLRGYETIHEALVKNPDMSSARFDVTAPIHALIDFGRGQ